jgi:hypothetical protein
MYNKLLYFQYRTAFVFINREKTKFGSIMYMTFPINPWKPARAEIWRYGSKISNLRSQIIEDETKKRLNSRNAFCRSLHTLSSSPLLPLDVKSKMYLKRVISPPYSCTSSKLGHINERTQNGGVWEHSINQNLRTQEGERNRTLNKTAWSSLYVGSFQSRVSGKETSRLLITLIYKLSHFPAGLTITVK